MKINKQSRGEVIMSKKVQLNDMELNQVAGGGWSEFWKAVKKIFTEPGYLVNPIKPNPFTDRPGKPIFGPIMK